MWDAWESANFSHKAPLVNSKRISQKKKKKKKELVKLKSNLLYCNWNQLAVFSYVHF